jgi:anti-sigma B factor antagonist
MAVKVRDAGKARVIDVIGRLVIGGPELEMREAVQAILEQGYKHLVINLGRVEYIDSAGLGELVACRWRVQQREGIVHIVRPEKDVAFEPFILTKLVEIFEIFDTELKAVGSF